MGLEGLLRIIKWQIALVGFWIMQQSHGCHWQSLKRLEKNQISQLKNYWEVTQNAWSFSDFLNNLVPVYMQGVLVIANDNYEQSTVIYIRDHP